MKKPIRAAVIGCGNIASVHADVLADTENIEITGFVDPVKIRAESFSEKYTGGRAGTFAFLEELIQKQRPDVIHICAPHDLHVPLAVEGLRAGCHVFMEKPPAVTRKQFEELKAAEKASRTRLGICFQNRFNETTRKVDAVVRSGELGILQGGRAFVTWKRDKAYYQDSGWKGIWAREGGGALINQGIHSLDLLLRWLGTPDMLDAVMSNHHLRDVIEVEDTMEAWLSFHDDAGHKRSGLLYVSTAYEADEPVVIELRFTGGRIRIEGNDLTVMPLQGKKAFSWEEPRGTGKACWGSGHQACIRSFYQAVLEGTPCETDLSTVENTFETMMRIYDSAKEKEGSGWQRRK